jgi:hypothetical protein
MTLDHRLRDAVDLHASVIKEHVERRNVTLAVVPSADGETKLMKEFIFGSLFYGWTTDISGP